MHHHACSLLFICYIMATFTKSEGLVTTHTNDCLETVLLQLNASNTYYTTGGNNIIFIKLGFNNTLCLDHTYHMNRHIFQKCTINVIQLITIIYDLS